MDDRRIIELLEIICGKLERIEDKLEDIKSCSSDAASQAGYCDTNTSNLDLKLDGVISVLEEIRDNS